jgi:hypothetical protein
MEREREIVYKSEREQDQVKETVPKSECEREREWGKKGCERGRDGVRDSLRS